MPPRTAYAQVAIAATLWGTWSIFLRPAKVPAFWSSAIMLGVVALASVPMLLRRGGRGPTEGPPREWSEWWYLAILAVGDAANVCLFFGAMETTTIAVAVLSHYLAPLFVALAAPTVLGTPRTTRDLVLAVVGLCGLTLVLEPWRLSGEGAGRVALGALLGGGSAVFYAINVLVTKRIGPRFTAEEQLVYHAIVSCLILVALAVGFHSPLPTWRGFGLVALASVLVGTTAGLMFLYGLRRIPAEHAGILTFLEPLTAVLVAWAMWHERPGLFAAVGGALVLGAGVAAVRGPRSELVAEREAAS